MDNTLVEYANDLNEENKVKYEERKNFDFNRHTTCDKCLVKEYGRKPCTNDKYKEVIQDDWI